MAQETEKTITLTDKNGHSDQFSPAHAARLLKYPGTEWSEVAPKTAAPKAIAAPTDAK